MKTEKKFNIPLDKFIEFSLYNKKFGYYMKKNPFGKKGDFITSPNISRLFSEIIAVWIVSFWKNIGSPKSFNLIELGAGNGEMMKVLIESFKKFPVFLKSSNIYIHEKSPKLIKIQKKKLKKDKIIWLKKIKDLRKRPSLFIANEFFDSMAIKQFIKLDKYWFERFVNIKDKKNAFFFDKKINMGDFEKKINFKISNNQNFIEYSESGINYLKDISKIVKKYKGGLLIIDYGYFDQKMKNTLQSIYNQNFSNILKNIGNSDITHNINFYLFKEIVKKNWRNKSYNHNTGKFFNKNGYKTESRNHFQKFNFFKKSRLILQT